MQRRTLLTALAAAPLSSFAAETKLRVAVIGHTGRGNYGHGLDTMWKAIPATEIVAIADADAKAGGWRASPPWRDRTSGDGA